ncbi:MAG: type II toxin-antitoxin system RelE/ParE family toxin [Dehalococcoidia bacterium]
MPDAFFTARAEVDIADIALFIAETNASLALTLWDEFLDAAQRLASGTAQGHRHANIRTPSLRVYLVRRWFLVYDSSTEPITVRRVVRATRDLASLDL